MKVTLDLTRLLEEGKINQAEFDKFGALSAQDTGSLAFNILIGFGVAAVSLGAVALVPEPLTAAIVGAAVFAFGSVLVFARAEQWALLAQICLCVGALVFAGGIVAMDEGSLRALLVVTAVFTAASIVARSGLLMVGAVLALASCLGASTGYWHATYELSITEPTLTIVLFGLLALAAYHLSKQLNSDFERLALMAARTSVLLVNFGFWIGSLWGDRLILVRSFGIFSRRPTPIRPGRIAALAVLRGLGSGAHRRGRLGNAKRPAMGRQCGGGVRRHPLLHAMVDRLGPTPLSFLLGGLLMLAFALGLWTFNRRSEAVPK